MSFNGERSQSVMSMTSKDKRKNLEEVMSSNTQENKPLIFLHEGQQDQVTEYTDEQLAILPSRDFKTRLFIANLAYNYNSVWVRNHHSDAISSESNFTYIRDYFKASFATRNHTAAKAIPTT